MKLPFQIDLTGKVAVVTGAGGVLCSMFAEALAQTGAKVALLDLNEEAANAFAQEIVKNGGIAKGYCCNVLDKDSLEKAHAQVLEDFGSCDILINGAGGNNPKATTDDEYFEPEDLGKVKTFFDLDKSGVEFVFNLNFLGTLLPTQVFAKDMLEKEDASIINISSMNAYTPLTKIPAYSGAKAAISNFTQWLAVHFSRTGIRCNAIAPGFFVTKQNEKLLFHDDGTPTPRTGKILNSTPMNRFGEAQELLGALLFLVSKEASGFVNGIVIPVDGGFSAYSGV
ncbi:SDR family oxidoreductase [Ructibacterium gallinarum]|uniref:SDR family oxidoreductase n=1 Tax=Ructibacterium gallinarum TaxID=2779355 RepID=A0A9D5R8F9_9FIRM|nr:SDR family oxidoreductase [Ructibacterium gallinarum]MBE5039940.1 SDR family oxidoreductase [Ructibacterium gallinarum]